MRNLSFPALPQHHRFLTYYSYFQCLYLTRHQHHVPTNTSNHTYYIRLNFRVNVKLTPTGDIELSKGANQLYLEYLRFEFHFCLSLKTYVVCRASLVSLDVVVVSITPSSSSSSTSKEFAIMTAATGESTAPSGCTLKVLFYE